MLTPLLLSLFVTASPPSPGTPAEGVAGLRFTLESNGIPGHNTKEELVTKQKVWATMTRLRLLDLQTGVSYLFWRDDPKNLQIWEVSPDRTQYRACTLGEIQRDRDRQEKEVLAHILDLPEAEREAELQRNYLRADGRRVVEVKQIPGDQEILGYPTKHYQVRENGFLVVDARMTESLDVTIPFFDFYRHVGAFSDQVLEKLKTIPGVPLQADFTVITAGLNYPINARVIDLEQVKIDEKEFDLPPNAVQLRESPYAICPICHAKVEKNAAAGKAFVKGETLYFDSRKCFQEWKRERRAARQTKAPK